MWRFLSILILASTTALRGEFAHAASPNEIHEQRAQREAKFELLSGMQFDVFRRNRGESPLFLSGERFDAGDDPALAKLANLFAGSLVRLAEAALQANDAALAYQLLNQAAYFGDGTLADKVIVTTLKEPVATLATTKHPRLGWKRRAYYRVRTDHYQVVTKDATAGIEIARRLENLYSIWSQLFFDCWSSKSRLTMSMERQKPLRPMMTRLHRVVLFDSRAEYIAYLRASQPRIDITLGFYDINLLTSYFFAGPDSSTSTQLHEATHQLFQEVQSVSARLPMKKNFWAIEGVAMYMESVQRRGPVAVVGGWYANRLQFARYRRLQEQFYVPLQKLVSLGRDELQRDERIRRIYSQSAGLTHFLMDDDFGRHRVNFIDYLRQIYEGRDGIQTLAALTSTPYAELDAQYLRFLDVTDDDLANGSIPANSLRSLCIGDTQVTDKGMSTMLGQADLEWLDLARTKVGDKGLRFLQETETLRQVNLDGTQITDQSLKLLAQNSQLEELDLSNTQISDTGIRELTELDALQTLWLTNTRITDATLELLVELKSLRYLNVSQTRVTADAEAKLRKKSPNLMIE